MLELVHQDAFANISTRFPFLVCMLIRYRARNKRLALGDNCVHNQNTIGGRYEIYKRARLRRKSAKVWRDLPTEREVIVTNNGRLVAILSAINETSLEESISAICRARAVEAAMSLQRSSVELATNNITIFNRNKVAVILDYIERNCVVVSSVPLTMSLLDYNDEPFLEVAISAGVDYLVTGNAVHFPANLRKGVSVVLVAEFQKRGVKQYKGKGKRAEIKL